MIVSFNCDICGNPHPSLAEHYDGCCGYEAIVCKVCGTSYDHMHSAHLYDPESPYKQYLLPEEKRNKILKELEAFKKDLWDRHSKEMLCRT